MVRLQFKELSDGLMHLFYPRLCEGCNKALLSSEKVLCIGCSLQLSTTNYHDIENNETALRFSGRFPFVYATSFAYFVPDGLLQHLIHGLKYKRKRDIGLYLGYAFGMSIKNISAIQNIDLIIPVPLHPDKQANRGYNQSMLIAEGLGMALNIPANDKVLIRVRKTDTQTRKTRADRITNIADAFTIKNRETLRNKHVLLCDDVLTTGATLEACALALLKEETIKISIATIGIAVS